MYCPKCFCKTLQLSPKGSIQISINGNLLTKGKYLFNRQTDSMEALYALLTKKIEEHFKWYSTFQNKEPIQKFTIFTSNITCENKCSLPQNTKSSVLGILYESDRVFKIFESLGEKYNIPVDLKKNDF